MMIQAALPPYSIVYEVEEPAEVGEFHDDTADIKQLIQAIEELNKNLSTLHEDMNPTEEETSEELTEEVTEEPTEQEPSDLEKKIDSIDKTISEINEREKTKETAEKEAEEQRVQEELNNTKSASTNLWTGVIYRSNYMLQNVDGEYVLVASNNYDVYKLDLPSARNFVFSYVYNGSMSRRGIRVGFYRLDDTFISGFRSECEDNIEQIERFSVPSETSYVLFSVMKDTSSLSLYSDLYGRERLIVFDESADTHLYLTSQVENASLNDIFTIGLSVRNLLLVFFLFWLALKLFGLLRAAVERVMNR